MEEGNGGTGLDSMLDGLLDNLDMGGGSNAAGGADAMSDIMGFDDIDSLGDDMSLSEDEVAGMFDDSMIPEGQQAEKKPGFFKKVFGNVVTDEIAEQERKAAQAEEEEAAKQAEEAAKAKEEKEAKKAEQKAEKEAKKAEKKAEKEAKKAEKAEKKAEKKAQAEEEAAKEIEVVGKLNKAGVSIIAAATALFLLFEIGGTNLYSYSSAKRSAQNYFEIGKYTEAYQAAIGTKMKEKDPDEYNQIKLVMQVQQALNAYQNYDRLQYYPEALDALLRGVKRYDANIEQGEELDVGKQMQECRSQILTLLQEEFGVSEQKAYDLLALGKDAYTKQVVKIGVKKK